jgi:hypothetical protein
MDNTDFDLTWRKRVMPDVVTYALRELRGDDVQMAAEDLTADPVSSADYRMTQINETSGAGREAAVK